MKAIISEGTLEAFSWTIDESVTPELVDKIEKSGDNTGTDWFSFQFAEIVNILGEKYSLDEIEEMIYDEDPEIIEIGSIVLDQSLIIKKDENLFNLIRLYFPVMQVIVRKLRKKNN
ncbi:MAG: hypothetical protein GPJ54_05030 [Candidatus Heimdallarchaeota archaeon]|nr:hypothetical protein [Candidatus Heimdallarchaeota archaeon]